METTSRNVQEDPPNTQLTLPDEAQLALPDEASTASGVGSEKTEPTSRATTLFSYFASKSLILDNTGLVARDHLSNERSFLAWMRTGLTMISLGIAFMQLYSIQTRASEAILSGNTYLIASNSRITTLEVLGQPLGVLCGVLAIVIVLFGYWRYLVVQRGLLQGKFPASRIIILTVLLAVLLILALILAVDIRTTRS